jgi:hypothetical protein
MLPLPHVQRKIDRIIDAITEGLRTPDMKEKLEALTAQKAALENRAANRRAPLPSLHPNLGGSLPHQGLVHHRPSVALAHVTQEN